MLRAWRCLWCPASGWVCGCGQARKRARIAREGSGEMNLYMIPNAGLTAYEATALSARLSAWHDAMVAHERRLRLGTTGDVCDDECPHADARALWAEAVAAFGSRAHELTFLRSRAQAPRRSAATTGSPRARPEAGGDTHGRPSESGAEPPPMTPLAAAAALRSCER